MSTKKMKIRAMASALAAVLALSGMVTMPAKAEAPKWTKPEETIAVDGEAKVIKPPKGFTIIDPKNSGAESDNNAGSAVIAITTDQKLNVSVFGANRMIVGDNGAVIRNTAGTNIDVMLNGELIRDYQNLRYYQIVLWQIQNWI